jgi:hypothetical protein
VRQPKKDPAIAARLLAAFDLYQAAEDMKRMQLRRRHPEASDEEIEEKILEWLRERPALPVGSSFKKVPWPRRRE